jgi:hypothetical protein
MKTKIHVNQHIYNIDHFKWYRKFNTFYGKADELYDCEKNIFSQLPFINGRKQFFIKNKKTEGFRRFRFIREYMRGMNIIYMYKSEDGIKCLVVIKK